MSYILSGHMPSDMEKAERLNGKDLFLVSRYIKENPNEFQDYVKNVFDTKSYNVTYDVISSRLLYDISVFLGLSSMSKHDKYEYSKITHNHSYDKVYVDSYCGPSSPNYQGEKVFYLGKFTTVNNNLTDVVSVCMPFIDPMDYVRKIDTKIGEVRFVYLSSSNCLEELKLTPEYGWVLADGATYNKNDYISAFNVYKTSESDTTFRVPNLTGFFKLNPGFDMNDPMKFIPYKSSNPPHIHKISQSAHIDTVNVSAHMDFQTTLNAGGDIAAHSGALPRYPMGEGARVEGEYEFGDQNKLQGVGLETYTCDAIGNEKTPTHNLMPAFVFIGEKNG